MHQANDQQCPTRVVDGVLRGRSQHLFSQFRDPAVQLILWERSLDAELDRWLNALPVHQLPDGRAFVRHALVRPAVTSILDTVGTPDSPMRDALLDDVVILTKMFAAVVDSDLVDIRLETIHDAGCWRFHRDFVPARMLTTYRGSGTQWVHSAHNEAALERQKSYDGPIEQFQSHAVGLFKGVRHGQTNGVVHRSPPVREMDTVRLLLCLNPPSEASPDPWEPAM